MTCVVRTCRIAGLTLAAVLTAACVTVPPEDDPVLIKLTQLESRMQKVERMVENQSLLELSRQVQALEQEMRELRGQMEQNTHTLENVRKQQRDHYVDLDGRISQLSRGGAAAAGSFSGDSAEPVLPSGAAGTDYEAYQSALALLQDGQYAAAGQAFDDFLQRWPQSPYAANSLYWLAESYYVRRQFAEARPRFQRVLDEHPRSGKVPDAMLKVGYCQIELGDASEGELTLQQVIEMYPDSSAARLAAQRLEKLGGG